MKRGTPNHPKTKALARALGERMRDAVGMLELLWHFTAEYAPDGLISRFTDADIAEAMDWDGDVEKLMQALTDIGWIDSTPAQHAHGVCTTYTRCVHDWSSHAEDAVHMKLARQFKYFADGVKPKITRLSASEKATIEEAYARHAHGVHTENALPSPPLPSPPLPKPSPVGDRVDSKDSKSQSKAAEAKADTKAAESIYAAYPRKIAKRDAVKAIVAAMARVREYGVDDPAAHLLDRVKRYAASVAGKTPPAGETDYRPHPATWFNAGRYDDDPAEWNRASGWNGKAETPTPQPALIDGWVGR
jgi:hypothetical protein